MKNILDKSMKIFSMYSRLTEFRNSKNYSHILNTQMDKSVINILSNVALGRKELFINLCSSEDRKDEREECFEKDEVSFLLKKYEIKLLQLIYRNSELNESDKFLIFDQLEKEKQSLGEIVKILNEIDIIIPHSWKICVKNQRVKYRA